MLYGPLLEQKKKKKRQQIEIEAGFQPSMEKGAVLQRGEGGKYPRKHVRSLSKLQLGAPG